MSLYKKIADDAFRYCGVNSSFNILKVYIRTPGFRFMVWQRVAHAARKRGEIIYLFPWLILSRLMYRYGINIPAEIEIGDGFYIGHFGGIVISPKAWIGRNVNISQGVTIGYNSRGKNKGYPKICDSVYIAPGAKIIGNVTIGKNAAIGANAVVLTDVPENGVAVGIPAKVISFKGSEGYILNKV